MSSLKILFLVRKNYNYGTYGTLVKAGLLNSVKFLSEALEEVKGIEVKVKICLDGNSIDKEIYNYKPNIVVIDAIWVTPTKLAEVQKLHPTVVFIMRIHSKIPFLANEGNSIKWLKEYNEIPQVLVACNNPYTAQDFAKADIPSVYLPNVYKPVRIQDRVRMPRKVINIGCFGAIRPLKNQLLQAFAAIRFANKYGFHLKFHINAGRIEQAGEGVLNNIRNLFVGSEHELVEHEWFTHDEFLEVVAEMDLGLQCSYSESYNIVAADFVSQGVPIVVSDEIYWMPDLLKADMNSTESILNKLRIAYIFNNLAARRATRELNEQREEGLQTWLKFLKHFKVEK